MLLLLAWSLCVSMLFYSPLPSLLQVLDLADDRFQTIVADHIRPYLGQLRKYTHGKHIIARIEKILAQQGRGPVPIEVTGPPQVRGVGAGAPGMIIRGR